MKAVLRLDGRTSAGGAALLMHNERLSDPLDPFAKSVKEISGKKTKTETDHIELARREFLGGFYTNENGPCLPAANIIRCLQEGAQRHKKGKDVLRGIFPLLQTADLSYEGPRDPEELWKSRETFASRKGMNVMGKKVMRTRPLFTDWTCELPVEIDPVIFNFDTVTLVWADAGKYVGIGDGRPVTGRFTGTVLTDVEWLSLGDSDTDVVWRANRTSIARVISEDADRASRHSVTN